MFQKAHDKTVTPVCKEIGLGPSMLLLQTKAVTILFLILTIINIPIFVFYGASNDSEIETFSDIFSKLSLGNIGQVDYSCN